MKTTNYFAIVLALAVTGPINVLASSSRVNKVADGTAVVCPSEIQERGARAKAVRAEIDGESLVLTMNRCHLGQWQIDPDLANETFVTYDGRTVVANYSDFKVLVRTLDWREAKTIVAKNLAATSQVRIPLSDLSIGRHDAVDVSIHANSQYELSSGEKFTDSLSWGEFRVRF